MLHRRRIDILTLYSPIAAVLSNYCSSQCILITALQSHINEIRIHYSIIYQYIIILILSSNFLGNFSECFNGLLNSFIINTSIHNHSHSRCIECHCEDSVRLEDWSYLRRRHVFRSMNFGQHQKLNLRYQRCCFLFGYAILWGRERDGTLEGFNFPPVCTTTILVMFSSTARRDEWRLQWLWFFFIVAFGLSSLLRYDLIDSLGEFLSSFMIFPCCLFSSLQSPFCCCCEHSRLSPSTTERLRTG